MKVSQLCLTLCSSLDCSMPGSSIHGILRARILAWVKFKSFQSSGRVRLFVTPWTAACQASLSITNSWNLLKFMSNESMTPSNHIILCCPLLLPPSFFSSIRIFPNESTLRISGQSIGVSASMSILPMNIQVWFPLGFDNMISLQSKGLSQLFSNTTVQKHQFFGTQLSL